VLPSANQPASLEKREGETPLIIGNQQFRVIPID